MSTTTRYDNYINGQWQASKAGHYFESRNPATNELIYYAARSDQQDVDAAVSSASAAFYNPSWHDLSQTRRGHLLRAIGDMIAENAEELARMESRDNGKLLREMRGQLKGVPEYFYYYAGDRKSVV